MKQALLKSSSEKQLKYNYPSFGEKIIEDGINKIGRNYREISKSLNSWYEIVKETEKAFQICVECFNINDDSEKVVYVWVLKSCFEKSK